MPGAAIQGVPWPVGYRSPPSSARSARGLRVITPSGARRDNKPRSADATVTSAPVDAWSRHLATISSSPEPGAWTVLTPATVPAGTPARAFPSSTRTTSSNSRCVLVSSAWSRAAAPARSCHQPSGTEPTTFAPSTTRTLTLRSFHWAVFAPPAGSGAVSVATPVNLPQSGQVYPRRVTPGGRKIQSCTSRARGCMGPCSASSTDSWQSGPESAVLKTIWRMSHLSPSDESLSKRRVACPN